jgi:mannosyltransferase OCH1-like enzyme
MVRNLKHIMIPKVILMCDKTLHNMYIHAANWKRLNPTYKIWLFDDAMCRNFLLKMYSPLFLKIFNFIPDGPIKADFWRVCVLYKLGGIYVDADIEPLVSLNEYVNLSMDLITCTSYWVEKRLNYNPNFIGSRKNNPFLKHAIMWYIKKFMKKQKYDYFDWSIMKCFTDLLGHQRRFYESGIYRHLNMNMQLIKEVKGANHYEDHNVYNGRRVFNNRYKSWDYHKHSF